MSNEAKHPAPRTLGFPPAGSHVPGDGPALWVGSIPGSPFAPTVTFRGPEDEAGARELYRRLAGGPDGEVRVTKAEG